MKIAIIGSGHVGSTLGAGWAARGHEIMFGVRDDDGAKVASVLAKAGSNAQAAGVEAAARSASVVALTVPWSAAKEVIAALGDLRGKILLDCINPVMEWPNLDHGQGVSGGEQIATWATGARVVKIFNTTGYENMADPHYDGEALTMFYAGDDAEAKGVAHQLAQDLGFAPQDVGPLANAYHLEVLASLWGTLAYGQKLGRGIGFRLVRR